MSPSTLLAHLLQLWLGLDGIHTFGQEIPEKCHNEIKSIVTWSTRESSLIFLHSLSKGIVTNRIVFYTTKLGPIDRR